MSSHLLISEAADLLGLTTKALHLYEKIGLVTPIRSENGYRVYTAEHVLRLLRVRRLRSLGLSLTQIKTLLDEGNDTQIWRTILRALLDQVDAQIETLEDRSEIEALLANGSTQKFIARRYGTTDANLSQWLRKHSLKRTNGALSEYARQREPGHE